MKPPVPLGDRVTALIAGPSASAYGTVKAEVVLTSGDAESVLFPGDMIHFVASNGVVVGPYMVVHMDHVVAKDDDD